MKKLTMAALALMASLACPAQPEGTPVKFYLDKQDHMNYGLGFMGNNHIETDMIMAGMEIYLPCPVNGHTDSYVKGVMSMDGTKITVANKQEMYVENGLPYYLMLADSYSGQGYDEYTMPEYTLSIDPAKGTVKLDDNNGEYMLGLFINENLSGTNQYCKDITYYPATAFTPGDKYTLTCKGYSNSAVNDVNVMLETTTLPNGNHYIKGIDQQFPDKWFAYTPTQDGGMIIPRQVGQDGFVVFGGMFNTSSWEITMGNSITFCGDGNGTMETTGDNALLNVHFGVDTDFSYGTTYHKMKLTPATPTGIGSASTSKETLKTEYFDTAGRTATPHAKGLVIKRTTYTDGTSTVVKMAR